MDDTAYSDIVDMKPCKNYNMIDFISNEQKSGKLMMKDILSILFIVLIGVHQIYLDIRTRCLQIEYDMLKVDLETIQDELSNLDVDVDYLYSSSEDEVVNQTDINELEVNIKSTQGIDTDLSIKQRLKRNTDEGGNDRRPRRHNRKIEAVHFEVDSAVYSLEIANAGAVLNVWAQRDNDKINFGVYQDNGLFRVTKKGLYLIYSQVTYYDNSGRWCHTIKRNSNIIAKCLASEWGMTVEEGSNRYVRTVHNCYTSLVIFLRRDDQISISSLYGSRTIHDGKDMSFWGLVKLA